MRHCAVSGFVKGLIPMYVKCRGMILPCTVSSVTAVIGLNTLLYVAAMCGLLHSTQAFGSYITMATGFSVVVESESLTLVVTAENRGDVSAHDVQFEITVDDRIYISPLVKTLGVDEKTAVEYSLADAFGIPGRYPIIIRTYYKDANAYPFSALTVGFYDYKSGIMPVVSISGETSEIAVDGKGQLIFVLHNDGSIARKIELALYIPDELSVSQEHSVIEIGPQQESRIVYEIENYSALANSQYQVSLVGQYEDAGNRVAVTGSAVVRVVGDAGSTVRPIWIWVVMGGLIPGVLVLLRLQSYRAGSRKHHAELPNTEAGGIRGSGTGPVR